MNRQPPFMPSYQSGAIAIILLIFMTLGLATTGYFLYDSYSAQDALNAQLDRTKKRLRFAQRDLREKEESLSDRETELYRLEGQRRSLKNNITSIEKELETLRVESQEKQALEKKLSELNRSSETLNQQLNNLNRSSEELNQKYEQSQQQYQSVQEKYESAQEKYQSAQEQYQSAQKQYRSVQQELTSERARTEDYSNKIETLEQRLAREGEALNQLKEKLAILDKQNNELQAEKKRLVKQFKDGTTIIRLEDAVLFPSGSAELNSNGQETLSLIAETLRSFPKHLISVEGHTDQHPIISSLAQKYPSNWELSAARASYAIRYLTEQGLPESQFQAVGYGSTRPIANGSDAKDQERNRRIEILLYPPDEQISIDSFSVKTNKLSAN